MKILLTGGCGFIGSNLAGALLKLGHRVTVLDDLSTGREENIREFKDHPGFEFVRGDIRDDEVLKKVMSGADAISHQAAIGSVPRSIDEVTGSLSVNVCGFASVLDRAVKCGIKRIIYASSSAVYGDCDDVRKTEGRTGKLLSPYAISKHTDELLAENWADLFGIEVIGLRYFNVFGPKQSPYGAYAAVIPKFCMDLINHRNPVINGDGSIIRDFTFVDNVVQANISALTTENGDAFGRVYNIAGGEQMTLNKLFKVIHSELSRLDKAILPLQAEHGPERKGDIKQSLADISLAEKYLNYRVAVRAEEGLPLAAGWYFEHRNEF